MLNRKKTYDLQNTSDKNDITVNKNKFSVYKGLLLAMLSGIFYSSGSVIVKQILNVHPGQLSVYRYLAIFTFSIPEAVKCQEELLGPKNMRFLLILRGVLGGMSSFCNFLAFRYLPLGESAVIIFSIPVFVTVAARVYLKEPCGLFQSFTAFTTVVGIILASKVPLVVSGISTVYTQESIWGLIASIVSLLTGTCQCIVIRKLKGVHHSIIMFHYGWIAFIESVILTALVGNFQWHDCGLQSFFIVVLGVLSYAGQTLITVALLCEFAGPVSTMVCAIDILLAFVWQTLLFRDVPDVFSSVGAVLVGFSVVFVALRKWMSDLSADSTCRRKFGWMLK